MLVRVRPALLFAILGIGAVSAFIAMVVYGYHSLATFERELTLGDASQYASAETRETALLSRRAMMVAMEVQKRQNLAPSSAARLYAYVATVYADSLAASGSSSEAFSAAMDILERIVPSERTLVREARSSFGSPSLSTPVTSVIDAYASRHTRDGYDREWDPATVPPGPAAWYVRGGTMDGGAMSGAWEPWIMKEGMLPKVPAPPPPGSVLDMLELEKVRYATMRRVPADAGTIFFWHGASGFEKGARRDNITPAGVWQNIFFVEEHDILSDEEYARAQKLLSQGIADAFIFTWREKYRFHTARPSMRDETLLVSLGDPPFPSYISGHSTISAAAAVILAELFPEKRDTWYENARDARWTRILGGIHFDIDNARGEEYGLMIGAAVVRTALGSGPEIGVFRKAASDAHAWIQLHALRVANAFGSVRDYHSWRWVQEFVSDIRFVDEAAERGIVSPGTPFAVWFDANGDDSIDLLVRNGIYINHAGVFSDETGHLFPPDSIGTGRISPTSAATGDIDGDGDEDIIMTDHEHASVRVYSAEVDGTYADTSASTGMQGSHPRGLALADFDGDRDLDVYIANWDDTLGADRTGDVNELWLNDGTGRFDKAAGSSGASGLPECPNYPPERYPQSLVKNAYQPVAFDYDNDGDMDIFIATDTWISPLYRNDGGSFMDVTYESGLCVPGTGMGVALADIDANGYTDIYVTNTGDNFLWLNDEGTFTEEAKERGVANAGQGWGAHFADFDNDGDDDLYVVNGNLDALSVIDGKVDPRNADALYQNDGGYFRDITKASGISGSWAKAASAVADMDSDGLLDVFVGGVLLPSGTYDPLFRNQTAAGNAWIAVRLIGKSPNTSAIGARVTVRTASITQVRSVASGTSFHAQDSRWLHFGIGSEDRIEEVVVEWPGGDKDTLTDVGVNQLMTVRESD